ncbi:MAG: undecaprenyl-phosphate glucose phosphotransferase [Planctomycetota bacterium]|nr:MAG: undecaprenyl-phosphate glucose phosphotransferase [Planctomycetota bacterium]
MLRRYAAFFSLLRSITDIVIIGCSWIAVYCIRFQSGIFSISKGVPDFRKHLILALPIICICYLAGLWMGFYKPKRVQNGFKQFVDVLKASFLSGLLVLAFFYYIQSAPYSRKLLILFIVILFAGLCFSHLFVTGLLRLLRKKGYNLRYYAVIGAGKKGQLLVRDIEQTGWLGLKCKFFVDNNPSRIGAKLSGVPVYGPVEKLTEFVKSKKVDEIFLTLSGSEAQQAYPILERLQLAGVMVRIVPDWGNLVSISEASTITIGSQVLFSAADSPLNDVNIILKEIFDRTVSLVLLIMLAVPMAIIAVLIKLTSKGPIFYRQTRVGMDGKEFEMLKFRTMTVDAEKRDGPQWAKADDPRRTRIGAWLRSKSLDELPQLINVLKGEMSLVGPRPERPVFVKQFSEEYKKYMFRHKLKAGMTGWSQVHGFRGDTSLKKRLQYDLYYIRNWSFGLDIRILLLTPWQIIKGKNAY